MIAKIEPTGISVRHGKVQLRIALYLEPGDARYDEHYVQVPVVPPEGYPGEVDAEGNPTDWDAFNAWEASLPKVWQNNPFHNHFVRVPANVPDVAIFGLLRQHLREFYDIWSRGEDIVKVWKRKGREPEGDMSPENILRCELKALDIANRAASFEHRERS